MWYFNVDDSAIGKGSKILVTTVLEPWYQKMHNNGNKVEIYFVTSFINNPCEILSRCGLVTLFLLS
jgi:hypothetical protein